MPAVAASRIRKRFWFLKGAPPHPSTRKALSVLTPFGSVSATEDELRVISIGFVSVTMVPGPSASAGGAVDAGAQDSIAVPYNLAGYWPLNTDTILGDTVLDITGGHNGALSGATKPSSTPGKIAEGLIFNGTTAWIDIAGLSMTIFPIAWSVWFKTSSVAATFKTMAATVADNTTDLTNLGVTDTHKLRWNARGNGVDAVVDSSASVNDNAWHHALGVSRGATDHQLFLDGVSVGTAATSVGAPLTTRVSIGSLNRTTNASFFPGSLDDARLYARAITPVEAASIYSNGLAGRT